MAFTIFISYRRDETDSDARSLHDRLAVPFGKDNIFRDVSSIELGSNFPKRIEQELCRANVVIAVIGRNWQTLLRERLQTGKEDWVRCELEHAFANNIDVIPVLVQGASMPDFATLPKELQTYCDKIRQLQYQNGMELQGGPRYEIDVERLIEALRNRRERAPRYWEQHEGRIRGRRAALLAMASVGLLGVWRDAWPIPNPDGRALGHLLYDTCWVTYDPPEMDLRPDRSPVFPDDRAIAGDLEAIAASGFNGIVTSTANGTMNRVPRRGQACGLRVLMGIWNPNDATEVTRAIREAPHVDAYCVGHTGLRDRYALAQLERAVNRVRRRTGKPAAVSELARHYTPELARLGDWLYPDAHLTIRDRDEDYRVDVDRDLERFMEATRALAPLAQQFERPLVFANVAYPHAGIPGATRRTQAEFFRRLLERINDPGRGHSVKVAIVAQTAFDTPWKLGKPFLDWDPHAGLLDRDDPQGLSPAGRAIQKWFPHLEAASDAASR